LSHIKSHIAALPTVQTCPLVEVYHAYDKKTLLSFIDRTDTKNDSIFLELKHFQRFFVKTFNLNQSQVCISKGLEAIAFQREAPSINCENEKTKILSLLYFQTKKD